MFSYSGPFHPELLPSDQSDYRQKVTDWMDRDGSNLGWNAAAELDLDFPEAAQSPSSHSEQR